MRSRIPLVLILALFVAAGCDQQPVGPFEHETAAAPEADWPDVSPEMSSSELEASFKNQFGSQGATVERYEDNMRFHVDYDMSIPWLLVLYDPYTTIPTCPNDPAIFGTGGTGQFLPPAWQVLAVTRQTPDGEVLNELMWAEREVYLYGTLFSYLPGDIMCEFLQDDWVYHGPARLVYHRKAVNGVTTRGKVEGHGWVEDAAGARERFTYKSVWGSEVENRSELSPLGQ